jgi:hypothetical protein
LAIAFQDRQQVRRGQSPFEALGRPDRSGSGHHGFGSQRSLVLLEDLGITHSALLKELGNYRTLSIDIYNRRPPGFDKCGSKP